MDAISSRVAPLRSVPALLPPRPSSTTHCHHHSPRSGLTLSSSCLRFFPPVAAVSSTLLRALPAPLLRRRTRSLEPRPPRRASVVASVQFNVAKGGLFDQISPTPERRMRGGRKGVGEAVLATAWRVAKDGVESGTNLVPDSVPRPIARIGVVVVAGTVALFLLKSLLSTALFVVAMMGLIYFTYIAFNAGEGSSGGPSGGGGTTTTDEETLEEARRIMEKYK